MTLNEKQIDAHLAETESDNDEEFSETESLESVNMATTTNNTQQQQHQQLNCSIPPMQPLNIDTTRLVFYKEICLKINYSLSLKFKVRVITAKTFS